MVNSEMLNGIIRESGLKREVVARRLGMSTTSLSSKVEGRTAFKSDEIESLMLLFNLSMAQIFDIFFSQKRDLNSHFTNAR